MAEKSKTAIEREGKAVEMEKIVSALNTAGMNVERILDYGTLAYMINEGALEGRFITIKVVLTKEYNEETDTGFNIDEAISEYELRVKSDAEKAEKAAKDKAEKEAKTQSKKSKTVEKAE
jgi:ribosomal protein S6